jgi:hypothetical protein
MIRVRTRELVARLAVAVAAWSAIGQAEETTTTAPRSAPEQARAIVMDARSLAAANLRYFNDAGRYAADPRELSGDYLPSIPAPDPTVAVDSYGFGAQHQVVLRLKADAYEVCRLLNRSTGFSSAAVPVSKPANSRDGCWKSEDGYRFEYLP